MASELASPITGTSANLLRFRCRLAEEAHLTAAIDKAGGVDISFNMISLRDVVDEH